MASIISRIVVVLVNRGLRDRSVWWPRLSRGDHPSKLVVPMKFLYISLQYLWLFRVLCLKSQRIWLTIYWKKLASCCVITPIVIPICRLTIIRSRNTYFRAVHQIDSFCKMRAYLWILKVFFFHIIHQLLIERHSLKHQSIFYPEMHSTKMNKTENQESTYSLKINY